MPGVSAEELVRRISAVEGDKPVSFVPSQDDIVDQVQALAQPGDLILTIGAGDIRQAGETLAKRLCE
jgi:UDP-N-acetylmuramate--alanine ligase